MKRLAVWVLGLFGCGVTGGLIGEMVDPNVGGALGVMAGSLGFICLRLFNPPQRQSPESR